MTREADITNGLSRSMAALGNAQNAVATLGLAVGEAQKAAERREREAQRVIADANARVAAAEIDVENLRAEAAKERGESELEKKAYRRGYLAGRASVNRGDPELSEDELTRRRALKAGGRGVPVEKAAGHA